MNFDDVLDDTNIRNEMNLIKNARSFCKYFISNFSNESEDKFIKWMNYYKDRIGLESNINFFRCNYDPVKFKNKKLLIGRNNREKLEKLGD